MVAAPKTVAVAKWDRELPGDFQRKSPDQLIEEWGALIEEVEQTNALCRSAEGVENG